MPLQHFLLRGLVPPDPIGLAHDLLWPGLVEPHRRKRRAAAEAAIGEIFLIRDGHDEGPVAARAAARCTIADARHDRHGFEAERGQRHAEKSVHFEAIAPAPVLHQLSPKRIRLKIRHFAGQRIHILERDVARLRKLKQPKRFRTWLGRRLGNPDALKIGLEIERHGRSLPGSCQASFLDEEKARGRRFSAGRTAKRPEKRCIRLAG